LKFLIVMYNLKKALYMELTLIKNKLTLKKIILCSVIELKNSFLFMKKSNLLNNPIIYSSTENQE
jgi:hypothetical protein